MNRQFKGKTHKTARKTIMIEPRSDLNQKIQIHSLVREKLLGRHRVILCQ